MPILNTISLESNKKIKINFNGGNLSSDGGLLLIREVAIKVGLIKLVKKLFKTNDHTNSRIHTDSDNLMQILYQIIAAYFKDDCSDELTSDPVLTSILEKETLTTTNITGKDNLTIGMPLGMLLGTVIGMMYKK